MTESVKFSGPIDQAAARDVVNKGPQHSNNGSNIVNLHINGATTADAPLSGQCLSSQQKEVLGKLVHQIVEVADLEPLEVWNKLLARASAKRVKLIPIERYVELEQYLEEWLRRETEAGSGKSPEVPETPVAHQAAPSPTAIKHVITQSCNGCEMERGRRLRWQMLASATATLALVFMVLFGYQWSQARQLRASFADATVCRFAGDPYSPGSVVEHPGGLMRCDYQEDGGAMWISEGDQRAKKVMPQRSR